MATILVTGFSPFADNDTNVSAEVVSTLAHDLSSSPMTGDQSEPEVHAEVLPVCYRRAHQRVIELLEQTRPCAVLLLGLHGDGTEIRLERVALNLDDSETADDEEIIRRGLRIRADGPAAYWSTLPLVALAAELEGLAVPYAWSNDAGTFLCNHVFYVARDYLAERGREIPCGFIHLPPERTLALDTQRETVCALVRRLRESSSRGSV